MTTLSPDTETVLLLCGRFDGDPEELKPLTPGEYSRLARWIEDQGGNLGMLFDLLDSLDAFEETELERERVARLIERGPALALSVERWLNHGLWVLSRAGPGYPARYRERLKAQAPPLLYGAGDRGLLHDGGLAIVGSRDVDDTGAAFARLVARKTASDNVVVISGGARGVDRIAMTAALEAGGAAVGVLADSLNRAAVDRDYRDAIRDQRLALISPYSPSAGFSPGQAMGRNRLIYSLAGWALVVDSSVERGGAWAGATENLKHGWTPLFVRSGEGAPEGNQRLLGEGGIALEPADLATDAPLEEILSGLVNRARERGVVPIISDETARDTGAPEDAIFRAVWPIIAGQLGSPRAPRELRERLGASIAPGQLRTWLDRAEHEGLVERLTRPVRYKVRQPHPESTNSPLQSKLPNME